MVRPLGAGELGLIIITNYKCNWYFLLFDKFSSFDFITQMGTYFLVFVCFWIDFQVILHSHSINSMLAAPLCYQPCQCFFILLELNWILTKSVPALLTLAALCASKKLLSWWVLILVILLSSLTYFCQISCHVCFSSIATLP